MTEKRRMGLLLTLLGVAVIWFGLVLSEFIRVTAEYEAVRTQLDTAMGLLNNKE